MPFIWEWPPGAPARSRNCWRPERKSWPYTGSWPPGSPVAPAARRQTDSGQGRQISGGAEHGSIYWKKRIRRNCHRQNPGVWQGGKTGKAREDTGSGSGNEPLPEGHGDGPGTAGRAVREGLTGSGGSRCGHIWDPSDDAGGRRLPGLHRKYHTHPIRQRGIRGSPDSRQVCPDVRSHGGRLHEGPGRRRKGHLRAPGFHPSGRGGWRHPRGGTGHHCGGRPGALRDGTAWQGHGAVLRDGPGLPELPHGHPGQDNGDSSPGGGRASHGRNCGREAGHRGRNGRRDLHRSGRRDLSAHAEGSGGGTGEERASPDPERPGEHHPWRSKHPVVC